MRAPIAFAAVPVEEVRPAAPDTRSHGHVPLRQQAVVIQAPVRAFDLVGDPVGPTIVTTMDCNHVISTVQLKDGGAFVVPTVLRSRRRGLNFPVIAIGTGEVACATTMIEQALVLAGTQESMDFPTAHDHV